MEEMDKNVSFKVQEKIDFGFNNFKVNKNFKPIIKNSSVNYDELYEEITRLINLTKKGRKLENFHSLFIYGPTGVGKTEICRQIAEANGCIYHKLEVQKIPIEEFEGFPYLEDREGKKYVRLANPTILPPSDDDRVWLLHLDEFNKADSDKMAAVMNLVLTGEIGGSADFNIKTGKSEKYRLPEKTIIIGSGNFRTQDNTENLNLVNAMDIATSERFHRTVFLEYNAENWLKNFAVKEFSFQFNGDRHTIKSRVAPIVMYYVMDKWLEEGNKAPFTIPISFRPDEGGGERTTSPRSWTLVSDNMLLDALVSYENLEDNERKIYIDKSKEIFKNEERAFDLFFQNPETQVELIANQTMEFGITGNKQVLEIISRYSYFAENRILPEQILFNYKSIREKVNVVKDKAGIILYLLLSVGYLIDSSAEIGNIKISAINISTFIMDTGIVAEDLTAFIYILNKSKEKNAEEIHKYLMNISERYKIAYGDFYYTAASEITNE